MCMSLFLGRQSFANAQMTIFSQRAKIKAFEFQASSLNHIDQEYTFHNSWNRNKRIMFGDDAGFMM